MRARNNLLRTRPGGIDEISAAPRYNKNRLLLLLQLRVSRWICLVLPPPPNPARCVARQAYPCAVSHDEAGEQGDQWSSSPASTPCTPMEAAAPSLASARGDVCSNPSNFDATLRKTSVVLFSESCVLQKSTSRASSMIHRRVADSGTWTAVSILYQYMSLFWL